MNKPSTSLYFPDFVHVWCYSVGRTAASCRGKDEANIVLQELAKVQVIDGGKLVPKKRKITLRMLLSHTGMSHIPEPTAFMVCRSYSFLTAGFGYAFFDARLNDFYAQTGLDDFSGLP
jgi:hypothetical protein